MKKNTIIPTASDQHVQEYYGRLLDQLNNVAGHYLERHCPCVPCLSIINCPNCCGDRVTCPTPGWNIVPVGWDQ